MFDGGDRPPVPAEAQGGREVSGRNEDGAVGACVAHALSKFTAMPNDLATARHSKRFRRDRKLVEAVPKAFASTYKDDARVDLTPSKSSGHLRSQHLRSAKIATPQNEGDSRSR
jgi:hypothetical protein